MESKNDCERDYIKEAFDKLYNCVMPFIDLAQFADADTAFKELDRKVHSEIYILKKCLDERDRAVDAGLTRSEVDRRRISDLEEQLAQENQSLKLLENSRTGWRSRAQHAEKRVMDLNKRIHELEEENTNLRVPPTLAQTESDKHPLHGDVNAITSGRTCCESLVEAIEFQNKKIEELEAEKARLKEAYDIHETTIKKENVDLSPGHEFEFGDEVFVPWSDVPYMYVKSGLMYNPRTERLVYVGKTQHLKWFGEKFSIV